MHFCAGARLTKLTFLLLVPAVLPLKDASSAALEFSAEIGGRYESNASNSNQASDRLADGFFTARLDAGTNGVWGRDWRWHAYLAGEGEQAFRFTGLSQIEGGVRLGVDRKFGLGWNAPRLQIDLYTAYRGSGQSGASGARISPSIGLVWQLVERGGLSIRYLPQWFFAEGAVFYSGAQEGRVAGWFDVFPRTRLFVDYSIRYGDVVSYATPPRPDLAAIAEVKEATDVFGAERMVYRFDAWTHGVRAGIEQELTTWMKLRMAYRFEFTQRGSLSYANQIGEIGLRFKF
jgi:hypothetical protein